MTSLKKILPILGLLLTLPACATAPLQPVQGQVLEEGTNKPIAGAIVVGLWYGTSAPGFFVDSRTVCYHVETATTDEAGRFTLTPTEKEYKYRDGHHYTSITAYKPGYQSPRVQRTKEVTYLQPFTGGREERFKYLFYLDKTTASCRSPEAGEKNLATFYRALYEEMKTLAKSREEADFADGYLRRAETLELGREEAERRARTRAEQRNRHPLKSDPSALEGIILRPPR